VTTSRRVFLQQTAAVAAGLSFVHPYAGAHEQAPLPVSLKTRNLIFDPEDIPRLQETVRHPRFAPFWRSMTEADLPADTAFLRDELKLNNHAYHLLRARQILERASFVYALTQDPRQLELARRTIYRILEYKRWDYFLEAGEDTIGLQRAPETTIAMVCAVEWLGAALPSDLRSEMERQIAEKGAPACYRTLYGLKYPERVRGWGFDPASDYKYRFDLSRWPLILNSTNLKVIPIAGLALAGCLLYDKHPQAPRWLDMAQQSARAFSTMFGADGTYDEGVGYWGYSALHLTLFAEVMTRRLGLDQGNIINFPGTVRYALAMAMPTTGRPKDCVNFGDAWNMGDVSVAAWTARTHNDRLAQYVATSIGEIQSHFSIIWFDPNLPSTPPTAALHTVRLSNDLVVGRTGWDEKSSVVALRSGGPANHEHADRNSVIFSAYGERLFHDPYHAAYSYTDALWFLRLTPAHTAVLLNGKGHQYHDGHEGTNASWAEAEIIRYAPGERAVVVTSDATQAYRLVMPETALVRRTVVFLKPDILLLLDHIRFNQKPGTVQVRFQVDNSDGKGTVTADAGSFIIHRPAATARAVVDAAAPLKVISATHPVAQEHGVYPFAEVASGEALEHRILTVCTAQQSAKKHGEIGLVRDGSIWTLKGSHNGRAVNVRIDSSTDLPTVFL
jgi:hypothetical protein